MKYMAIILQARLNQTSTDFLRQQVTQLHVRFYFSLFIALSSLWYFGRSHLNYLLLVLYSFWVPQILYNIFTEAKRPLHIHYIYGMSLTRVIFPLYIFGYQHNFLKEANSDFPTSLVMLSFFGLPFKLLY